MNHEEMIAEALLYPEEIKLWANDAWAKFTRKEPIEGGVRVWFTAKAKKITTQWILEWIFQHELLRLENVTRWAEANEVLQFHYDLVKPAKRGI